MIFFLNPFKSVSRIKMINDVENVSQPEPGRVLYFYLNKSSSVGGILRSPRRRVVMVRRCMSFKRYVFCVYSRDIALPSMETWRGETVDCNAATVSLRRSFIFGGVN